VGAEALPLIAPIDLPAPIEARLVSVHRHADELYLRYRIGAGSIGP
jgi:hypothetical protein